MARKPRDRVDVTRSSGNVFTDLGFAKPEEEVAKAHLVMLIQQAVKRLRLSQTAAAARMGVDQPEASYANMRSPPPFTSIREELAKF